MLTITRKCGERILIGDDIMIVVKRVQGGQVRLGIDAPRDVTISRAEIQRQRVCSRCQQVGRWQQLYGGRIFCPRCFALLKAARRCS